MKQMKMEKKKKNLPSTFQPFVPPHSPKFAFEPFVDEQLLTPSAITKFLYILKQPGSTFSPPHFLSLSMISKLPIFASNQSAAHVETLCTCPGFTWPQLQLDQITSINVGTNSHSSKPATFAEEAQKPELCFVLCHFEPASCGSCSCCPPYTLYLLPPCGSQ